MCDVQTHEGQAKEEGVQVCSEMFDHGQLGGVRCELHNGVCEVCG